MNIQTHCSECARAYQLGYASATEFYLAQLQKLLSTKSCPDPIMMEPPVKCAELQDTKERDRVSGAGADAPSCIQRPTHQIDSSDDTQSAQARPASNKSQPETVTPSCDKCVHIGKGCYEIRLGNCNEFEEA